MARYYLVTGGVNDLMVVSDGQYINISRVVTGSLIPYTRATPTCSSQHNKLQQVPTLSKDEL